MDASHFIYDKNFVDFIAFCLFSPLSCFFFILFYFLEKPKPQFFLLQGEQRSTLLMEYFLMVVCVTAIIARIDNKFFLSFANIT